MSPDFTLETYFPIFIYLIVILGFAVSAMAIAHLVGPDKKTPVKMMPYESGMDPVGDAHQHFDVKFYLVAILFLVFDVELLFLYPWAASAYGGPNQPALIPDALRDPVFWEIIVFLVTLAIGYIYAWRRGVFQWR
jgi:NADH-quinone oxidoreductase subunit A